MLKMLRKHRKNLYDDPMLGTKQKHRQIIKLSRRIENVITGLTAQEIFELC